MTDTSSFVATHQLPQQFPVTAPSLPSPLVNGSLSDTNGQDEEDYTIKCICAYTDDDGNTVLCEKCDTWQHIKCYYHGEDVPDEHFCADCRPRELDGKRATERQRRAREQGVGGDRKIKRPSSKGQKRRTKEHGPNGEQTNGWHGHERHDSVMSSRDQQPPQKKAKTAHRNSGSIASLNGTPNFSETRKRASSNVQSYPSPSKSPQDLYHFPSVPKYTTDFLELYERDEGGENVTADARNIYDMQAMNKIRAWHADPQALAEENGRPNTEPPFINTETAFSPSRYPQVSLEIARGKEEWDGVLPSWRYLRLQTDVSKNDLVGEIAGEVGLLQEYSRPGQSNRWQELHHPDPFVFFHQHMNIYIDSRKFGTKFRYLRRSCRPNLTLKTYVSRDGEYHHCFVASRDIAANTELTASWHYPTGRFNDERDDDQERQRKQIEWVSHLLANFGDCACDRTTQQCLLAPVDRRYTSKQLDSASKQTNGRKRKTKPKHAISPLSTGQATNSRAGSEAVKGLDDDEQSDRRSVSGSSRSGPGSRDMTPTNHVGLLDAEPVLGPGLSARERRKIEAQEKAFRRLEKDQTVQKKTKKRTSGGSNLNTPTASNHYQTGQDVNGYPITPTAGNYVSRADGRLQQMSGSPPPFNPSDSRHQQAQSMSTTGVAVNSTKRNSYIRRLYVDASVQTDPEEPEETPPLKRRKYLTPTQRLLRRVHEDRMRYEQQQQGICARTSSTSPSPVDIRGQSPLVQRVDCDIEMKDVALSAKSSSAGSPMLSRSPLPFPSANSLNSSPLPLPSQAAHSHRTFAPPEGRRLQLNTLPPVPTFPTDTSNAVTTPSASTPALATPLASHASFGFSTGSSSYPGLTGSFVAPSPVKKKLSLADYKNRRSTIASTSVAEKSVDAALNGENVSAEKAISTDERTASNGSAFMVKPNESIKEEAIAGGGLEGSAIEDVPMNDEEISTEQKAPATGPAPVPVPIPSDERKSTNVSPMPSQLHAPTHLNTPVAPEVMNVLAMLRHMSSHTNLNPH
jgi:uncharacterized protein